MAHPNKCRVDGYPEKNAISGEEEFPKSKSNSHLNDLHQKYCNLLTILNRQ